MNNQAVRIIIFFIVATLLSNIFRFQLFGFKEIYESSPVWLKICMGPLQSAGIFLSALIGYQYLRRKHSTERSLMGTMQNRAMTMGIVPIIVLSAFGLKNSESINPHLLGALSGLSFLIYCVFEEYGWRGYLSEELYNLSKVKKIFIVTLLWYTWHLSFIYDFDVLSNLKFFGILLLGSWGIEHVVSKTKSIVAAACFHMIYNIMMMQSDDQINFPFRQKILTIVVCIIIWLFLLRNENEQEAITH